MTHPSHGRPGLPPDIQEWPQESRVAYLTMTWSRRDLVRVLVTKTGDPGSERLADIEAGNTRLLKSELAAVVAELELEQPER